MCGEHIKPGLAFIVCSAWAFIVCTQEEVQLSPPRLFQCSNASGSFRVEEIVDFTQEDLIEDDVMLLDTYDQVFVWVGKGANAVEKQQSLKTAVEYVKSDPAGRDLDSTQLLQVRVNQVC